MLQAEIAAVRTVSRRTGHRYVIITTGIINGPGVFDTFQRVAESAEDVEDTPEAMMALADDGEVAAIEETAESSEDGTSDDAKAVTDVEGGNADALRMCRPTSRGCKPPQCSIC